MRGVNTELSYKFDDMWSVYASYAYNKSEMKSDVSLGATTYATDGKTLVNAPKNVGYASVNFTDQALWASLSVNAQSAIWGTFLNYSVRMPAASPRQPQRRLQLPGFRWPEEAVPEGQRVQPGQPQGADVLGDHGAETPRPRRAPGSCCRTAR